MQEASARVAEAVASAVAARGRRGCAVPATAYIYRLSLTVSGCKRRGGHSALVSPPPPLSVRLCLSICLSIWLSPSVCLSRPAGHHAKNSCARSRCACSAPGGACTACPVEHCATNYCARPRCTCSAPGGACTPCTAEHCTNNDCARSGRRGYALLPVGPAPQAPNATLDRHRQIHVSISCACTLHIHTFICTRTDVDRQAAQDAL